MNREKDNKFGPHLSIVLQKMCEYVGADYNKIDFSKENWYSEYSWSEKKQDEFINWMVDYLYNNNKARKEILAFSHIKKKSKIRESVNWFVFNYGWAYEK